MVMDKKKKHGDGDYRVCFRLALNPHLAVFTHSRPAPHLPIFFRDMTDQSGSTHFWARFEHALQAYQTTTGVILAEHPLAVQLQSCRSIDSMTTILQYEARAFSDLPASDRILKAIESIVSILCAISATPSFCDAAGLVRDEALIACFHIPDMIYSHSHLRKQ